MDVRVLQEILGHENLGTTEIYTHLSNRQMREAAESNPLADVKAKIEFDPETENTSEEDASLPV